MPIYDGVRGGWKNPDDGIIENLLGQSCYVAAVGISPDSIRRSFGVYDYLLKCGYQVIPFKLDERIITGKKPSRTSSRFREKWISSMSFAEQKPRSTSLKRQLQSLPGGLASGIDCFMRHFQNRRRGRADFYYRWPHV